MGQLTDKVSANGHDVLPVFGIGADLSQNRWRSVVRQLSIAGFIHIDAERFQTISLTEAARPVLRGEQTVRLREVPDREPGTRGRRSRNGTRPRASTTLEAGLDSAATACFDRLRAWRSQHARESNVPAYVIFNDATLREIARAQPMTLGELGDITGVGKKKLETYGETVLRLVAGEEPG